MVKKFLLDHTRCIRCTGCEAACKTQNDVPVGIHRIKVVTVNEGKPGEKNIPMPCMHCNDAPCVKVCPTRTLYKRDDGVVLLKKSNCIGCGYCLNACPFGAPQFPGGGLFGSKGKMDKCTFCTQPFVQEATDREAKPKCAAFCATKALDAGEADEISERFRQRVAAKISPLTSTKV